MKTTLLLFGIFCLVHLQVFSQDLLLPTHSKSFGLNHHTNRDMAFFSHVDTNSNLIVIGTTEKDSTFTDIVINKLDQNSNLVWQKVFSEDTNLSYDIPIKSFISASNDIYIVGRSSFIASNRNGLLFVIKYDENGTLVFHKIIGNINGSDYVDYDYVNAYLNERGQLSLIYSPDDSNSNGTHESFFLKLNTQGDIISSFSRSIAYDQIKVEIVNDIYYLITKKLIDSDNYLHDYHFYKIQDENIQYSFEITDPEFVNYYNNVPISIYPEMIVANDGNCYLICSKTSNDLSTELLNISKIDSNNNVLNYSLTSLSSDNYKLMGSFINDLNQPIILANNNQTNSLNFLSVDATNALQTQTNTPSFLATGFKKNSDDSFFITTSNSNIRLFSNDLTELTSFNTSNTFELTDFSKIDNTTISVIGTSYDKMFPASDYFTQLDIQAEKVNDTQIVNNFSFSGIGTSKAFQQKLIIDNDNNYLVLVTEKMGPEYLGIGGTNPPMNKRIIKYDSNLNKLWESEIPEHIFNLVNHNGRELDYYLDSNNNLNLYLPRSGDYYGVGFDLYRVTPDGLVEFLYNTEYGHHFFATEDNIFLATNYFLYEESSILKILDRSNGNLIEQIEIGHEEFLDFFSIGSDTYFYTYEILSNNTPDILYLYKNGEKVFTRNLPNNYGIYPLTIDSEGSLFFATHFAADKRLNKVDINNVYTYYNTTDRINSFKHFNNGNIFIFQQNNNTLILDENLDLIIEGENITTYNPYMLAWGDYMLVGTHIDKLTKIIDQTGTVISEFSTQGPLHEWYSAFDRDGELVIVGEFGNKIYTFNEYSWFRGFIHKYGTLNAILNVDEFNHDNAHEVRIYPNPTSGVLNIKLRNDSIEKVILYDLTGKQLQTFYQNTIDLKNFNSGLYLIKIFANSQKTINSKIIKE